MLEPINFNEEEQTPASTINKQFYSTRYECDSQPHFLLVLKMGHFELVLSSNGVNPSNTLCHFTNNAELGGKAD